MHFTMHETDKQVSSYVSVKFEEKREEKQNCEISHIDRITLDPTIYIENQNLIIISMCGAQDVQDGLGYTSFQTFFGHDSFRRFSDVTFSDSWDVSNVHVAKRFAMHGLVAMHERIAHRLNIMDDWVIWLTYRNGHMQLTSM